MRLLRAPISGLFAVCLTAQSALACMGPELERTVFFREVPAGLDAPVIAKVTVVALGEAKIAAERRPYAVARVEHVIKGTIDRPRVWISAISSSCGPYFKIGFGGVVLGTLREAGSGALELLPVVANPYDLREVSNLEGARP